MQIRITEFEQRLERSGRVFFAAIAVWFLVTRVVAFTAMHAGDWAMSAQRRQIWDASVAPRPLQPVVRWDATFYLGIANDGYPAAKDGQPPHEVAFFPLYPALIRGLTPATGNAVVAAVLVSNVAALLAACFIAFVASYRATRARGLQAAMLFLAMPGSHFLSLPYSEALFAVCVASAMLLAQRGHPLGAGLAGALASASRPPGLVVAVMLAVYAWRARSTPRRALLWLCGGALAVTGLVIYALFLDQRYGDPLAFSHVQSRWGRHLSLAAPITALTAFSFDPEYYLVFLFALAVAVLMIRRGEATDTVGAWFLVLLPLSTGSLKSIVRFQSANVPMLVGAPRVLKGRWFALAVAAGLALMAYEAFRFSAGFGNN